MARKKSVDKSISAAAETELAMSDPESASIDAPAVPATGSPGPAAGYVLNFDGNLAVQHIDAARQHISAALSSGGPIAVDLGRIAVIDTAGVQLLLALEKAAASRGLALELRGESAVLANALGVLGLQDSLRSASGNAVR
jgi:anti-anti-sigma regulatory factor